MARSCDWRYIILGTLSIYRATFRISGQSDIRATGCVQGILSMQPETRYASSGGVNIAYQVLGTGPHDLVFVLGWVSNIEGVWEQASFARFLTRLSSFSRLILFDKRGTGLSDRVTEMPGLEVRMDD